MIEKVANLWDEPADARCITTNGFVKKNGQLVMGAGVAGQAQARYPWLPLRWGQMIDVDGLKVSWVSFFREPLTDFEFETLISFPVKYHWREKADLRLIERSAHELMTLLDKDFYEFKKVLLPLPGCGNGGLSWTEVKPVLEPILDDRVWVISNELRRDFQPS